MRREKLSRELAEEMEFHAVMKADAHREAGLNPDAAAQLSRKEMGNVTLAKEESRDAWSFGTLEQLLQDMSYAARMFRKTPGFTTVALLSLALGIGGNAAMFSLVNALLVRPLPFFKPDRLVRITGTYPRAAVPFFQQQSRAMDVAAISMGSEFNLTGEGEAVRITGSNASANFFATLGVAAARGRTFQAGEDTPGRDKIVILSDSLWKSKFAGNPMIIGRMITLDGVNREVIGIMPREFSFPSSKVALWVPMRLDPANSLEYWGSEFVPLIGRLRPGATTQTARVEVPGLVARFRRTFPYPMARDWNANPTAIPLQQDLVGDIRGRLIILLCSVALVLVIACTNLASLLLSRATTRRKEIALRAALGAGRQRIVRQLLTESVLLALAGGVLGILLGMGGLSIFKSLLPVTTPGLSVASIDMRVGIAVAVLAVFTGLGFGMAPALSASQIDLTEAIKTGSQRSTAGVWTRFRSWLIAAEVALTVLLVIGAGLLMKSLYMLSESSPGFQAAHILAARISPNQSECAQRAACIALYERVLRRAKDMPEITDAAIANSVPLDGEFPTLPVDVEGHPKTADHPAPMVWASAISPGYLRMLRIPLLAGRELTRADGAQAGGVVLISASAARRLWGRENPIGKHIKPANNDQWRTVVGVVADVRQYSLSKGVPDWIAGTMYMPHAQAVRDDNQIPAAMTLVLKATADSARLESEIRGLVEDQNPNVPVGAVKPLTDVMEESISDFRSTIRVLVSFGATALILAGIGIYGLVSYWVAQRRYEIGLRVAIGAARQQIISMILGESLRVTFWGIGVGVIGALALTRFLGSLLYGVGAWDPLTFVAVIAVLLAVALAASFVPALRAARINPMKSLRVE